MYIADLHIHSRYSRATSRDCTPEYLDLWARKKGIHLLGTGDFTHPAWRQELKEKLTPAEEGLYCLREDLRLESSACQEAFTPRFVVSGEISSIYKKNGRVRKVHNVILLPGIEEADKLAERLEIIGNIHSDGRPILGLDSRDLLEITLEVCPRAILVPAHIWTPHFSMFGAFSGFDTVEECFEDMTPYIHAFETGLSSDPPMNWRLSALDRFQMISNSDAHSPSKLGREANLLDIELSYDGLYGAIQEGKGLTGTIEFFPEEGKYHYDGHRKCHLCLSPREAEKYNGKCPVCQRKLTLGVSHRIEQLADREEGFVPPNAAAFESLVPLPEVIASSTGYSAVSAKVQRKYEEMLAGLGNEFSILREKPIEEIQSLAGYQIGEGIRRLRQGRVRRFPGFDGEYGVIELFEPSELEAMEGQMSLFTWDVGSGLPAKDGIERRESKQDKDTKKEEKRKEPKEPSENQSLDLNDQQLSAVRSVAPRIAVIAGPGTGKTKTLVSRILYLLQNRRVKPSDITAVTFTNKAAGEMKKRVEDQLGRQSAARKLRIGTFHSLCREQLIARGEEFTLVDESTAQEIVRETADRLGIKGSAKALLQRISQRKAEIAGESPADWIGDGRIKEGIAEENPAERIEGGRAKEDIVGGNLTDIVETDRLLEGYQNRLSALSALDFDDLLIRALQEAEKNPRPFSYLLVDEFQDISPLQYRLIQAWSKGGREVFIIGDPNQAIYGFRGADDKGFWRFCQEESAQIIRLEKNYRSSPEIIAASAEILKEPAPLEPVQSSSFPVRLVQAPGQRQEAIFIAKEINRLIGGIDMLDVQEGFFGQDGPVVRSFGDIAVLYRTHRQAELLETCLKREGIPYVVTGREDFLDEEEVRGSLNFFRSLLNPQDSLSLTLCLKLLWKTDRENISQCDYLKLAEKYKTICRRGKPQKLWDSWKADMEFSDHPSMDKLASMAVFYKTMEEMLTALAFGKEGDIKRWGGKQYTADAVTLMTIHGSKGLEFPAVVLYGLTSGLLPLEYKGRETDLQEERRLLYVAMTRAKEELILTCAKESSPFVRDIPEKILHREQIVKKRTDWDNCRQMSLFDNR